MSKLLKNSAISVKTPVRTLVLNKDIAVGGQMAMPFVAQDGTIPQLVKIALEILFKIPDKYPKELINSWNNLADSPVAIASKAKQLGATIIALRMEGLNDENIEEFIAIAKEIVATTALPLAILGINNRDADKKYLPILAEKLSGLNCLLGPVEEETYKEIIPAIIKYNHPIIARTPIDVNLAKQLNILITEMGLSPDKIIMDPNMGGLGYGLDYAYSVIEKIRLAAFEGDQMLNMPIVVFSGEEAWRTKEAKSSINDDSWGNCQDRSVMWEILSTSSMIMAGADIVIMKHPVAIQQIASMIGRAQ